MASKDDAKPRKVIDVSAPGKTAPPATSKPIIITNRPILRRDPMMAPTPDGINKDDDMHTNTMLPPMSRVTKPLKVAPLQPLGSKPAITDEVPTDAVPASKVGKKIALEVGEEALASVEGSTEKPASGMAPGAPAADTDMLVSDVTPIAVSRKPAPGPAAATFAPEPETKPTPEAEIKPAAESEAKADPEPAPSATPGPKPETEAPKPEEPDAASTPTVPPTQSSVPDDPSDDQLAPNKAVEDAVAKQKQEEAARNAEVDKIVSSKEYFLPIKNTAHKHSTRTAVMILIIVILLALVWLDIVLDAGLLHINGVQPLTHFFTSSSLV